MVKVKKIKAEKLLVKPTLADGSKVNYNWAVRWGNKIELFITRSDARNFAKRLNLGYYPEKQITFIKIKGPLTAKLTVRVE